MYKQLKKYSLPAVPNSKFMKPQHVHHSVEKLLLN